jgi:hypothetical protein
MVLSVANQKESCFAYVTRSLQVGSFQLVQRPSNLGIMDRHAEFLGLLLLAAR